MKKKWNRKAKLQDWYSINHKKCWNSDKLVIYYHSSNSITLQYFLVKKVYYATDFSRETVLFFSTLGHCIYTLSQLWWRICVTVIASFYGHGAIIRHHRSKGFGWVPRAIKFLFIGGFFIYPEFDSLFASHRASGVTAAFESYYEKRFSRSTNPISINA